MAHVTTNAGVNYFLLNVISTATDIRMGVFRSDTGTVPTDTAIRSMDFVSEFLSTGTGTAVESTAALTPGPARKDLASVTAPVREEGSFWNKVTAAAATYTTPTGSEIWGGVFYYIETAAGPTDGNRILISVDKIATPIVLNGQNITAPSFEIHYVNT